MENIDSPSSTFDSDACLSILPAIVTSLRFHSIAEYKHTADVSIGSQYFSSNDAYKKPDEIKMNADKNSQKTIDIVIPIFNEEQIIEQFYNRLQHAVDQLPYTFKFYFIDDGSKENTHQILTSIADKDPRVVVVQLSRNFGQQVALTAGLDISSADAAITMDSDGQHPPELLGEMLELYTSGYDIVLTQRISSGQRSWFKRLGTAAFIESLFFIVDTKIIPGAADFRLLSRDVIEGIKRFREYHRLLRGIVAWMGFRTIILPCEPKARIGGDTKYTKKKMFQLAQDAISSYS